ncbi:MAG: sec-independent protein translocase protein TatA [Pseudonocardiales bacterium]|jgi:sec-independent protein translocase protein TatA|nr:sec-independent protein translocase protein TatA [Pseudonocardiales bacterium]MDT4914343.1 sec-independent protein translocase protein TatA [Pseudonocardiales bacterium]
MGLENPKAWVIIAIAAIVLFGYKKLPDMSRSVGRSLRIFKTEMQGLNEDEATRKAAETPATPPPPVVPPTPAPQNAAPVVQPEAVTETPPVVPPVVTPTAPSEPIADTNGPKPHINTSAS